MFGFLTKLAAPKLILGGLVLSVVTGIGGYVWGRLDGRAIWKGELDTQRAVWQVEHDKQVAETKRVQGEWDATKERESVIQKRLEVVTAESAGFARSLYDYRARLRALSDLAASTGQPDPTSGIAADLESLEGAHYAACSRDAERLTQFQAFYEALRLAQ